MDNGNVHESYIKIVYKNEIQKVKEKKSRMIIAQHKIYVVRKSLTVRICISSLVNAIAQFRL